MEIAHGYVQGVAHHELALGIDEKDTAQGP
jgi:hypothetical protein